MSECPTDKNDSLFLKLTQRNVFRCDEEALLHQLERKLIQRNVFRRDEEALLHQLERLLIYERGW